MSRPAHLVSPWVDGLAMGGLSMAAWLWLLVSGRGAEAAPALTVFSLVWAVNGSHFAATNYRLYSSAESVRQYPLTAFLVPLLVAAGAAASLRWPLEAAPYFVKLFLLWSPYHYSGQTVGLSKLYARRAGYDPGPLAWRGLSAFVFGTFLVAASAAEARLNDLDYYGVRYPSLGLPAWTPWACAAFMAAGGLLFAWETFKRRRGLPWLMLVPPAAQFVWFVPGYRSPAFMGIVPVFHGLQYLLVAWFMQIHIERARPDWRGVGFSSARWALWSLAGYVGLFWGLPQLAAGTGALPFAEAAVVAHAAVQIHHFFVDGVIWRLRDKRVAEPLMGGALS